MKTERTRLDLCSGDDNGKWTLVYGLDLKNFLAVSVGFWICMKMIKIYYFDSIVTQLTDCLDYANLFWSDEELYVRSFLCCVPWFVIADTFYRIKAIFKTKEINDETNNFRNRQVLFRQIIAFFTSAAFNSVVIYTSTKRWELVNFGAFSILSWIIIRYFELDICDEDEPSVIGERVASVYWEGFLKYVNHHLGDHQFDEFEKNHPEMTGGGYEFNDRSLIILIPSSANFPKVLSRKKNGFEKIQDRFCEIPVNIPGEFSSRVYNHRKPIKLDAQRVYLDLEIEKGNEKVQSFMKNILFDFPMCLKSCIGNCDFDENVKRVNVRSFRKKLEHYLSQTENKGKFISFIEINDSNTKVKGNDFIENLVYAEAVHRNLRSKNTRSVSKTDSKKLQEVIIKDSIITKSKQE